MIKFKESEIAKLETFRMALLSGNISRTTADGYCKRLLTICREENIDVETLAERITDICYDYIVGDKKELGKRSHNSYRSALIKFESFVLKNKVQEDKPQSDISSNSKKETLPKKRIEIQRVPNEHFGTIKLYGEESEYIAIDYTKDVHIDGNKAASDDILFKCLLMLISAENENKTNKIIKILQNEFNVSITIDGKKIM